MYRYHSQLKSTHAFESRWYTWPMMLRPVWYYMGKYLPAGMYASIAGFGSPVVWWGGTAALAAVLSLLTSVAGLPEVDGGATLAEIQDGGEHEG